jgi:signal transduction histidine kinase
LFFALALVLALLGVPLSHAADATTPYARLTADTSTLSLSGQMTWRDDPEGQLTLAAILAAPDPGFEPLPGFLNRGYTAATSWLQVRIERAPSAPADWYLWLAPPILDRLDVYVQTGPDPSNPQDYRRWSLGDHAKATEQLFAHPHPVVPLSLPETGITRIYIAFSGTSTQSLTARLLAPGTFVSSTVVFSAIQGGYLAIALALGLVNLILAARLRDRVYLWYGLYLFTLAIGYLAIEGLLGAFWPAAVAALSDLFTGIGTGLGFATIALFAMALFGTASAHPWLHRYLQATALLGLIAALVSTQPAYRLAASLLNSNGLVLIAVLMFLSYRLMRQGELAGRLFFLAFFATALGGTLTMMRIIGLAPLTALTHYALQFTAVAHMILMTLALTERVLAAETAARCTEAGARARAQDIARQMTEELCVNQSQLEQALAAESQAREEQQRFLDLISHEYRTPLATLRTNRQILELKTASDWPGHDNLARIAQAEQRLSAILDQRLEAYRLATLKEPQAACLPPCAPLHHLETDWPGAHQGRPLRIDCQVPAAARVRLDLPLFEIALFNLLDNAHKYAPLGSVIGLAVGASAERVCYQVESALTAPLETRRLDQRYVRGSNSSGTQGLGLGLDLVQRIAAAHGGLLDLDSRTETCFIATLWLPLAPVEEGEDT